MDSIAASASGGSVTLGTASSSLVVAANENRVGLTLKNVGSNVALIKFGDGTITSTNAHIQLASNEEYTLDSGVLWRGSVYGLSLVGATDLRYVEFCDI